MKSSVKTKNLTKVINQSIIFAQKKEREDINYNNVEFNTFVLHVYTRFEIKVKFGIWH